MAKKTGSKSDAVRNYLGKRPTATIKEIVEGLKSEGVSVSTALASKIKYGRPAKAGRGAKPGASKASAHGSKAEAIRDAIKSMGKRVRPRDVISSLAEKGIRVSSAQVSTVAKSMGMRRRRGGGRQPAMAGAASRTSQASAAISIEDLIAAKKLANQLGGIDRAKVAVDALAKLG